MIRPMKGDLRPRFMPDRKPLWPLKVHSDDRCGPLYVEVPGAILEVQPSEFFQEGATCSLHIGGTVSVGPDDRMQLSSTGLVVSCPVKNSNVLMWTMIELPEGAQVVWEWEQANELLRRRFQYLESLEEVLPPSTPAPAPEWPFR